MTQISPIRFISRKIIASQDMAEQIHDYGELYYSYHGIMELIVNDKHYVAPKHYCIWLPPNTAHRCISQNEVHFFTLHIEANLAKKLSNQAAILTLSPLILAILEHLHDQFVNMQLDTPNNQHLLQVVYEQLQQAPVADNYLPYSTDLIIAPILKLLHSNPADERSIKQLAHSVNTTERTLMRRANQALGMSLAEWKLRLRIIKGIELLNDGYSVEHTALELGYSTSSAFINMFRKTMGVTPGEYRKL